MFKNILWKIWSSDNNFKSSKDYWNQRYLKGGDSGSGSYGRMAEFKAGVINEFIKKNEIKEIIEFGCGDGNQLKYLNCQFYIGYDVSKVAVEKCCDVFSSDSTKEFRLMKDYFQEQVDLTVSIEVIFHLIEDDVYHDYMEKLFSSSKRFVIIFSSNTEDNELDLADHVRHREFTRWIEENNVPFKLKKKINNKYPFDGKKGTSFSDFYIFEKYNE